MNHLGSIPTARLNADAAGIAEAARLVGAGGVVAFPTETVYGLGADATDPVSVAKIFAAKERPRFNPLISHLPDLAAVRREGVLNAAAERLAEAFWPGPLTLVVPASSDGSVCDFARAGLQSVALRVPDHPIAREILSRANRPIAAPSANRSGRVSPTTAEHVLADLDGRIAAILDGGTTRVGLESTVVACFDGRVRLLRPGGVTREDLARVLGAAPDEADNSERPVGPGLLASHYAPRAAIRLNATRIEPGEAALLFGPADASGVSEARAHFNLSPSGDLVEAAARLFAGLHRLDASGASVIAVAPVPGSGLGEAINDRLRRAAAPR
ncbi:L-threonylcarbamoyladenylate synthase [Methylobacterium iners]|uniref:Threonylcarbamoyl-AMP synthase n=1 Tax=Methylobacterium iners TaxID=418707 RepID=A0ABQ4RUE3_9HYPH|nr:L-threonylcarbamoyladenylate synthase [Methylobacterium iners]GJD93237.1 Threonylcarbamoyl-AMP synthase [Methylobacterium iners]